MPLELLAQTDEGDRMMLRRKFITLLGGAAAWPLTASAQQGNRVRRIGVLMPGVENDPLWKPRLSAFTQALAGLGWTDGRNLSAVLRPFRCRKAPRKTPPWLPPSQNPTGPRKVYGALWIATLPVQVESARFCRKKIRQQNGCGQAIRPDVCDMNVRRTVGQKRAAGVLNMDAAKLRAMLPGVPLIESPFFEEIASGSDFDEETAHIAKELNEKGFAVLRFPDDQFDQRAERIKQNLAPHFDFNSWRAHGWKQGDSMRVQDAWSFDDDVRAIASNRRVLKILGDIYGRKAWPFQTLNFPVGTQQHFHSDSVHFSSIPERFMCGVGVALEDVTEGAGPLEYYPGSHRWPIVYNDQVGVRVTGLNVEYSQELYHDVWEALVEKAGIAPEYFFPHKGDALIWAANLLHGGSRQDDPNATRWSQVSHYFFENCCYINPRYSDVPIGKLMLRDLTNIATGTKVPNIYIDSKLSELETYDYLHRLQRSLRHPLKTTRKAAAMLWQVAGSRVRASFRASAAATRQKSEPGSPA
jgi:hypothetical protein